MSAREALPSGANPMRVTRIREEAEGIRSFALAPTDGSQLPTFQAGAHIDLHLPCNLVRAYSLTNGPLLRDAYRIAVKREEASRGGSAFLHAAAAEGMEIAVSQPRCNFALLPHAVHSLLIAGGIGITPLLSMARHLAAAGRSFSLAYFARSPATAAFDQTLRAEFPQTVDFYYGLERSALSVRLQAVLAEAPTGTHAYLCGPRLFMDLAQSLSPWPCHREDFRADPERVGPLDGDRPFQVHLARSGRRLEIPAECSLADMLIDNGVILATSCEEGLCRTCLTRVLEGQPEHRDSVLSEEERRDFMLPCVSRSRSPLLVLDL